MSILAELVFFAVIVGVIIDYVRMKIQNKLLTSKVDELSKQNNELLELVTNDSIVRIGDPPPGKHILHG